MKKTPLMIHKTAAMFKLNWKTIIHETFKYLVQNIFYITSIKCFFLELTHTIQNYSM